MSYIPSQVYELLEDVWDQSNHWLNVSLKSKIQTLINGAENDSIGVSPVVRADAFQTLPILVNSAAAVDLKAATASKKIYVTDLLISIDAGGACDLIIRDDTSGTPLQLARVFLPAAVTTISLRFATPKWTNTNQKLQALSSSATPNIYVTVSGYVI